MVLHGIDKSLLTRLQTIQNTAARLITRSRRHDHITPILYHLHWLPIHSRIEFKILLYTWKCLHGLAPVYLSELVSRYTPTRALRSATNHDLNVTSSKNKKHYGPTAFSIAAPTLWNALPLALKTIDDFDVFKSSLKTHLFRRY